MKWMFAMTLACAVMATGAPAEAQSKYDICSAYGRDAMMAFYASSAVPVTMTTRSRQARRGPQYAATNAPGAHSVGSHQSYFKQCMAR